MNNTKFTLVSMALLLGAGQAFAHTGVRDVAAEGSASYNGFTITHGCGGDSGKPYPVTGQAAVFPVGNDVVWRKGDESVLQVGGNGNNTISTATLSLGVTGYASSSSAFATTQEIVDDLGNVRGLLWKDGVMEPKLNTVTPFKITAPTIVPANTVKCLKVRIGVINYCDYAKNQDNDASGPYTAPVDAFGRAIPDLTNETGGDQSNVNGSPVYVDQPDGNGDDNRADWWFKAPYGGSAYYQDPDLLQTSYWTTLTVVNSSNTNDIAKCNASNTVSVEPTGAAFDAILNSANTAPFSSGNGPQ